MLRKGAEIVIATPGRLNDCIDSRYIVLNQCNYIVLDEADRMIGIPFDLFHSRIISFINTDMGFEPQVISVLDAMPASTLKSENEVEAEQQEKEAVENAKKYRITTMYSATMPAGVERLARKYLRRPAYIAIGEAGKTVDLIKQVIEFVKSENDKRKRLEYLLENGPSPPIIVFANKKKTCDAISKHLERLGVCFIFILVNVRLTFFFCSIVLRPFMLDVFKSSVSRLWKASVLADSIFWLPLTLLLVALMSRVLLTLSITICPRALKVNYCIILPFSLLISILDYTHRIGRTGRAGESGLATSFLMNEDTDIMYDLKNLLTQSGAVVPNELAKHPASQHKPGAVPDRAKRSETVIYAK